MYKYTKTLLAISLCALTALGISGCSDDKSKAAPQSKKLVIYTPNSEAMLNALIPKFEKDSGIKVELISAGTGEIFKRVESEVSKPYSDVVFGGSAAQFYVKKDLFQEYVSKHNEQLIEQYRNKQGSISPFTLDGSVLLVNKNLAKDLNIKIESYDDLLNPALKGKIATADPATSSSAFAQLTNILLAKGGYEDPKAWEYLEKLVKNWDGKIKGGSSAVYKSVADGEMVVGLTYEDPSLKLIADGAPVEIVYPKEGAVFLPGSMAIVKGAPNLENAKLFIDFVLSEEVQDILGMNLTNRPIRTNAKVKETTKKFADLPIIYEDAEYVRNHKNDLIKKYMEIFVKSKG